MVLAQILSRTPSTSALLLVILPVTALACLYAIPAGFLGDDFPLIETASRTSVLGAFGERIDVYYRPIVWASFAFEYVLWGANAAGFHVGNLSFELTTPFATSTGFVHWPSRFRDTQMPTSGFFSRVPPNHDTTRPSSVSTIVEAWH